MHSFYDPHTPFEDAMWLLVRSSPFHAPFNFYEFVKEPGEVRSDDLVGFAAWTVMLSGSAYMMGVPSATVWTGMGMAGLTPVLIAAGVSTLAVDLVIRLRSTDDPYGFEDARVERARSQSQSSQDWEPRGPRTIEDFQ